MSEVVARGSDRLLLSTRFALMGGFGGLLLIMAVAGIYGIGVLEKIRRNDDAIRKHFLSNDHALNDIRSQLYLSGTYVRDYLLAPEPGKADAYLASLEDVRRQMDTALASFGHQLEPGQIQYYTELSSSLARYWQVLAPTFQWGADQRRREGYVFLRDEIFPRRAATLAIADRIAYVNERQLDTGNRRVDDLLSKFQQRLGIILLAALALGLGMAAFSTWKILRLEVQAHNQYQEVVRARRDLGALSARLVHAQEDERRALSRELHDEVGQALSAVLVELHNISVEAVVQADEPSRNHVETVRSLVEDSVRVVRNMALLLRPSMLDDLGLVPALQWQAREASKRTSMDVSVATELAPGDLSDESKTCIYRVVQESLHNCSRHARATKVQIRVQQETRRLFCSIQDDGQGFDVKNTKGLGLLGIEERVTRLGGKCAIHSVRGSGTIVAIELPLKNDENKEGGLDARGNEEDSDSIGG